MRGKRSKAYRKLLKQFELAFGFRQPYQVLVDAEVIMDSSRFAMDLQQYLERTLHGDVKVLVTQCSMRHLYAHNKEPGMERIIDKAKMFERRRCGHHPDQFPDPLSTIECLSSVVDSGGKGTNKHRYVVASQDQEVRAKMRSIPGVPLIYISRSVMIMEPMAGASTRVVNKGERAKFRAEIKTAVAAGSKRKRDDDDSSDGEDGEKSQKVDAAEKKKKFKKPGVKGPNPLAVKKKKRSVGESQPQTKKAPAKAEAEDGVSKTPAKKKRKRKSKKTEGAEGHEAQQAVPVEVEADS